MLHVPGLNLVGRARDLTGHPYQQQQLSSFTAMECDPSPSRHPHPRQRYPAASTVSMMNHGPQSLQYAPYPGSRLESTPPSKHNQVAQSNGPQSGKSSSNDRDDSPMVGVCVQQSPVVIHWKQKNWLCGNWKSFSKVRLLMFCLWFWLFLGDRWRFNTHSGFGFPQVCLESVRFCIFVMFNGNWILITDVFCFGRKKMNMLFKK